MTKKVLLFLVFIFTDSFIFLGYGWSNGGYSEDQAHPKYGTHDWIAQFAWDWQSSALGTAGLSLTDFLYGTELPDNGAAPDGIGDTSKHHVYFRANGSLQDDASATRAQQEENNAVNLFRAGYLAEASKRLGMMTHYISDVGVFGHVMGSSTDWGEEAHHSDYENYVNSKTDEYGGEFSSLIAFDGSLDNISAYDATITLAYDTTFDYDKNMTCVWMDQHYSWADPVFQNRCGESLNLAVNLVADAMHTAILEMLSSESSALHVVINEFELNPSGTDAGNEWVELLNPTATIVNVGGWTISTTAGQTVTVTIPYGTTIQPFGYWVCTHASQWLDNSNESVILRDSSSSEVDRTPFLNDDSDDGSSWSRYPNGVDTDSSTDWRFQASTKGTSNGKVSSSVTCSVNPLQTTAGSTVKVSGQITPIHSGALVEVTLTKPNGTSSKNTAATNSSGSYEDEFLVDSAGTWVSSALWHGDYDHDSSQSAPIQFDVEAGDVYPPVTAHSYDELWHTTDFAINLTATDDFSGVNETFYRVNDGPVQNISISGQPIISSERANNTLEYWSLDNIGREEAYHLLAGIKLDKSSPTGSVVINNRTAYTNSTSVTLNLTAMDSVSGVYRVRISNDGVWDTEPWEPLSSSRAWIMTTGDGVKTVYFQIEDFAGLVSDTHNSSVVLDMVCPSIRTPLCDPQNNVQPSQPVKVTANITDSGSQVKNAVLTFFINESTVGTESPMNLNCTSGLYETTISGQDSGTLVKYQITAYDNAGNSLTNDNAGQYYLYMVIPEFQSLALLAIFIFVTLTLFLFYKRK